jgi:di/tricarboxylate transporter
MSSEAILTLIIILGAVVLFATEIISIDLVALLIIVTLVVTGVISAEEGVAGFSNSATLTVAFMFVLSAALLRTGALQFLALKLGAVFKSNFTLGMLSLMLLIALFSAFINNTPVVAVFIPVVIQIAQSTGLSANKMLIPISFAAIFGGTCTLIGTSTNILVSGILEKQGIDPIGMFEVTPLGIIFLVFGITYMIFFGIRLLPNREVVKDLKQKFGMRDYMTDIQILPSSKSIGRSIMDSELVKELEMDVIEVNRAGDKFVMPPGDFVLQANDFLKVRCNVDKIRNLKDQARIKLHSPVLIGDDDLKGKETTMVELIITSPSELNGITLKEADFRRRFRAVPLAIRHREELFHDQLYDVVLRSGDVILAEVKNHYVKELKRLENEKDSPFIMLSEEAVTDFDHTKFYIVLAIFLGVIITASMGILNIMIGTMIGVIILVLLKIMDMREVYEAINWKVVFLLAGSLCLGTAMTNSGLDTMVAGFLVNELGRWGPVVIISGLYLFTSLLTEMMSNNAAAALLTPVAIATGLSLGLSPMPFVMAIMFAASASFMTPVGYQTNTMVYSAGQYKFMDFVKVGGWLNLLFWIIASIFIPWYYGLI